MPTTWLALIAAAIIPFVDGAEPAAKPTGTPPKAVSRVEPEFPYNMKAAGIAGNVTIAFVVDTEGTVRDTRIVRSNNPWFERPAIEALLKWKFEPAVQNGRKVNTRMQLPIKFVPRGEGADLWRINRGKDHDKLPPELQWDQPPEAVSTAFPVYPFEMLRDKVNARVGVGLLVDPAGQVVGVKLIGTPAPEFAGAIRAMAAMWQFKPAKKKGGRPCAALVAIEHEFRADGRGTVPVSESAKEILRELGRTEPRIVAAGALDTEPKDLSFRDLLHPPELKSQGVEGEATIEFFIDRDGDVQLPRIVSATHEEFGHFAALVAACWRFEAPRKDGKPVIVRVQRVVKFKLKTSATVTRSDGLDASAERADRAPLASASLSVAADSLRDALEIEGAITAFLPDPAVALAPSARFPNWWTDDTSPAMAEGIHHGANSVSQRREACLRDFADRLQRRQPQRM